MRTLHLTDIANLIESTEIHDCLERPAPLILSQRDRFFDGIDRYCFENRLGVGSHEEPTHNGFLATATLLAKNSDLLQHDQYRAAAATLAHLHFVVFGSMTTCTGCRDAVETEPRLSPVIASLWTMPQTPRAQTPTRSTSALGALARLRLLTRAHQLRCQ